MAWRLALDEEAEPWQVRAAFADQLMETSVRYWEGVALVENASGERIGIGYLEMTGHGWIDDAYRPSARCPRRFRLREPLRPAHHRRKFGSETKAQVPPVDAC